MRLFTVRRVFLTSPAAEAVIDRRVSRMVVGVRVVRWSRLAHASVSKLVSVKNDRPVKRQSATSSWCPRASTPRIDSPRPEQRERDYIHATLPLQSLPQRGNRATVCDSRLGLRSSVCTASGASGVCQAPELAKLSWTLGRPQRVHLYWASGRGASTVAPRRPPCSQAGGFRGKGAVCCRMLVGRVLPLK